MTTVLIARRLRREPAEDEVAEDATDALRGAGAVVIMDTDVNWAEWRALYGGWKGAYQKVAQTFDAVVLVEGYDQKTAEYFIARGQATIAEACLEVGTRLVAWRGNHGSRVRDLARLGNDWGGAYAACVLREDSSEAAKKERGHNG